jgi:hypothetical protein
MPDVAVTLWILPAVLAWWMVRALNSIRLDVRRGGDERTTERSVGSSEPAREGGATRP